MTIESNRTLGGVGACLAALGIVSNIISLISYTNPASLTANVALMGVSSVIGVVGFVGFILFLVAMYGFSRDYGEHKIFNYILWGILIMIIAAVVAFALWFAFFFVNLIGSLPNISPQPSQSDIQATIMPYIAPLTAVIGFVSLIYTVFVLRAFNLLADKSGVPMFRTGAKVLLAGSLVTIVFGVVLAVFLANGQASFESFTIMAVPGGIVQGIGWVLLAKAYFSVKAPAPQPLMPPPVQYSEVKYCPHCGAQNEAVSAFCINCGQKL